VHKLLTLAAIAALAGCAAQTPPEAPLAQSLTSEKPNSHCLQSGTRIRLDADQCSSASGRTFSQQELEQTGEIGLAEALRKLDPSIGR